MIAIVDYKAGNLASILRAIEWIGEEGRITADPDEIRKLKKAGFIQSQRGPFGGHMLAKSPAEITVGDIVRILEETTAITDCAQEDEQLCGECNRAGDCLSRWVWVEASRAMFDRLDNITVESIINK